MTVERLGRRAASLRDRLAERGVQVRAIVSVTVVALTITVFGALVGIVTYQSATMTRVLIEEHEPERAAMNIMADSVFLLNNRLLGVMAEVYSAPGSADKVLEFGGGILDGWKKFEELGISDFDAKSVAVARDTVVALPTYLSRLAEALKKGETIEDFYDEWLDLSHPLRTLTRTVDEKLATDVAAFSADLKSTQAFVVAGTATALVVGFTTVILIAVGLIGGVVRPIAKLTAAMGSLAEGAVDTEIPVSTRRDEMGAMARAVEVFKRNMIENLAAAARDKDEADAKVRRGEQIDRAISQFEAKVTGIVQELGVSADETYSSAEMLSGAASRVSDRSAEVSEAADGTAENIQTVASAAEQLSAAITSIGDLVTRSERTTTVAVDQSHSMTMSMQELADCATKVGDVVRLIEEIAAQTKLLALNATIEAARAGDAGKGFAVVASEVKSLATQTERATSDITAQIDSIRGAARQTAKDIDEFSTTIGQINEITAAVAEAVREQRAATEDITVNVHDAAGRARNVTQNIEQVAGAASDSQSAAVQLQSTASLLRSQGGALRTEVDEFVSRIRAA